MGEDCALVLTTEGEVYTLKDGQAPQLLNMLKALQNESPIELQVIRVTHILAGATHLAAVSEAGQLFTWGDGLDGCQGDYYREARGAPGISLVQTLAGVKVASVSAGHSSTLAVTRDGAVYAFGCTKGGRLGIPPYAPAPVPCHPEGSKAEWEEPDRWRRSAHRHKVAGLRLSSHDPGLL